MVLRKPSGLLDRNRRPHANAKVSASIFNCRPRCRVAETLADHAAARPPLPLLAAKWPLPLNKDMASVPMTAPCDALYCTIWPDPGDFRNF